MESTTATAVKAVDEAGYVIPYEMAARIGGKMPEGLSMADQVLFLGLRMLHGSCRLKIISEDQSNKERNSLIHKCEYFRFRDELSSHWERSLRKTEAARAAYRKERTLENADRLLEAVEGR
ncbi:MAG: hypothetical protein IJF02_05530 [Oscillospiraceae bacterium]|nr:hypothetical protein [Oscillospiraceae bacterium]